jgi:tungstate transport system ATP-binding protein
MAKVIEVENLKFNRGKFVLDIPRLSIEQREVISLIGPNGAGKSTLLQVMACLEKITAGKIFFQGQQVQPGRGAMAARRQMAMVFQEPLLVSGTVYDNVALGLKFRKASSQEIKDRVPEWLERFGIGHLARRSAKRLSGGEAQRVSLARAFILEPEVLFLDEPFTFLDAPTKVSLMEQLEKVIRATKVTTLFITHDASEIPLYTDRVIVMDGGRIDLEGKLKDLYNNPCTDFLRAFFWRFELPARVALIHLSQYQKVKPFFLP